jgi:hypothetical protein
MLWPRIWRGAYRRLLRQFGRAMARSRGVKSDYKGVWNRMSKLLVRQAASAELSRGSYQYRAIHRDWEEPELSNRRQSLGY